MANAMNNNKLIAKCLTVTNEQTQKTLQHKNTVGGEHVNSKTRLFQKAEFSKRVARKQNIVKNCSSLLSQTSYIPSVYCCIAVTDTAMEAIDNMEARKRSARALAIAAIDSIEKRPAKVTKKLAAVVERWVDWNHLYEKRFWRSADGTVDDWFCHHIFHPNTWVNYGGSRHGACLDGYCLYADNRYCSCKEKTEHFEAWEAFDHLERALVDSPTKTKTCGFCYSPVEARPQLQ
jgi:hypothetical protein